MRNSRRLLVVLVIAVAAMIIALSVAEWLA